MADPHFQVIASEDDIDQPMPTAIELQELDKEKRILSSVYRHVEHQQAVEQVAGVAGAVSEERALSVATSESKSPSSPWMASLAQKTPSLPISTMGSEASESISGGIHIRMSLGAGSIEAGDRAETVEDLVSLPPSLDTALRINMALQRRFRENIQKLEVVFMKNLERQTKLKDEISSAKWVREQDQKTDGSGKIPLRISHFCVPYFKNRSGMPAPMNEDAKMKVKTGYIDLYVTRPRTWLTVEKERLEETVRKEWREQNISSCEMAVRELQRKLRNISPEDNETPVKKIEDETKGLQECINHFRNASLNDIALVPDRGEKRLDWDRIAARGFDGHRTSDECRLQWENALHPIVNTDPFTENEDLIVQKVIMHSRSKVPDWERIAFELRTNRTAFQVMQRYVSFIEPAMKPKKWTKRDSDKLLHTINMLRVGIHIPWSQVHQHLVGFSRAQVQSRWRMIDPEISKGPFTVEEDFILIKGLHMFGLNFDSIAHFMPGRLFPQVRERYRRTILPGLSRKPWTKEEDAIMIKECAVGARNWRKMIMQLPRFDACQIRCRYHIIQVWQTISGTNMIPPPLFPVTATVNPEAIQEIRKAMIMESSNLKQLVDQSRKGIRLKNVVKELEERRLIIKERKSQKNLQKMKKVTERRGRQPGIPNPHYKHVQDIFLTEFFVPFRHSTVYPSLDFGTVQHTLMVLCNMMQIKILKQVTEDEVTQLSYFHLTPNDLGVIQDLTANHVMTMENCCARNCPACEPVQPERIPLLPPCKTTIGTFRSLLIHRPKLSEMAKGDFFLYRYSRSELMQLDANCKGKRFGRKKNANYTLQQEQNVTESATGTGQSQTGNASEADVSQDESDTGLQTDGASERQGPSKRTKFHVTRQTEKGTKQKKGQHKVKRPPLADMNQGEVKAYSRGKVVKSEPLDIPSNSMTNIKLEVNGQEVDPANVQEVDPNEEIDPAPSALSPEEEKAREASENLLFQRMLSIFYWPAMMTLALPPQDLINQINTKIASGDLKKPRMNVDSTTKKCLSKDDLGIEEQSEYIRYLAQVETIHQKTRKSKKAKTGSKDKPRVEQEEISLEATTSNASSELDEVAVKEEDLDGSVNELDEDHSREASSESVGDRRRFNKGLASHHRKRSLKSLRRSLVMKKIWDARRKGNYPERTANRDTRHYNPRGSRTRDRVRKDMIKPPKAPKPWDFPLGGPLRVQPQVPFIPSQEMLALSFSESTSNSNEPNSIDNLQTSSDVTQDSSKIETKDVKSKKCDSQQHLEVPVQNQGSSMHMPPVSEATKKKTGARSEISFDINPRGQRRRKSTHSEVKLVTTPVEVHAAMSDEPRVNLFSEKTPETKNSSKTVAGAGTKNKPKMSTGRSSETQPKSQGTPSFEALYDALESSLTEAHFTDLKGATEGEAVPRPLLTSKKVSRPSRKRTFEATFQNLLDDAIEDGENIGEKSSFIHPEEAFKSSEIVAPQTTIKKAKRSSYRKSCQVSFQSLLDDPVDVQDNSSLSMEVSPGVASSVPLKIQAPIENPYCKQYPAKLPRKPPGSLIKEPSAKKEDESQVALQKEGISKNVVSALISSDEQLRKEARVMLHQLPENVVQSLLDEI